MSKPEHRISAAMVEAARKGDRMSLARLVEMFDDAGVSDPEGLLRGAVRAAFYNAQLAAGLLELVNKSSPAWETRQSVT